MDDGQFKRIMFLKQIVISLFLKLGVSSVPKVEGLAVPKTPSNLF